jgi:hypothetical protein
MTLAFGLLCLLVAGCGSGEKVGQDAKDAHVYAYPLMTKELTRQNSTNVAAQEGSFAPMGLRTYGSRADHVLVWRRSAGGVIALVIALEFEALANRERRTNA